MNLAPRQNYDYEQGVLHRAQIEDWKPRHQRYTWRVIGIASLVAVAIGGVKAASAEAIDSAPGQMQIEGDGDATPASEEMQLDLEEVDTSISSAEQLD